MDEKSPKSNRFLTFVNQINHFLNRLSNSTKSLIKRASIGLFITFSILFVFWGWQKGQKNIEIQKAEEQNTDTSFTKSLFLLELEKEQNKKENSLSDESFIESDLDLSSDIFEESPEIEDKENFEIENQDFILEEELYQVKPEDKLSDKNSIFLPTEIEVDQVPNFKEKIEEKNDFSNKNNPLRETKDNLPKHNQIFRPE